MNLKDFPTEKQYLLFLKPKGSPSYDTCFNDELQAFFHLHLGGDCFEAFDYPLILEVYHDS